MEFEEDYPSPLGEVSGKEILDFSLEIACFGEFCARRENVEFSP